MPSRKEFNKYLDSIPPHAPYKVVQNLREAHYHFHQSHDNPNEGEPIMLDDPEKLCLAIINSEPTHLRKALILLEEDIYYECTGIGEWQSPALEVSLRLFTTHNPPIEINHRY